MGIWMVGGANWYVGGYANARIEGFGNGRNTDTSKQARPVDVKMCTCNKK